MEVAEAELLGGEARLGLKIVFLHSPLFPPVAMAESGAFSV